MNANKAQKIIEILTKKGVIFVDGLQSTEILQIEEKFQVVFPTNLQLFLQTALPISNGFIDWRFGLNEEKEEKKIRMMLNAPLEGIIYDIKYANFWFDTWGKQPDLIDDKILIAKKNFQKYAKLIPIYGHRYIPYTQKDDSNPVFSVYQTDVIYFGENLENYFLHEFNNRINFNFQSYIKLIFGQI